jgi:hypothetical protein
MVFSMIAEPYAFRMFFAGAGSPESFFWDCANPARNVTALTGI